MGVTQMGLRDAEGRMPAPAPIGSLLSFDRVSMVYADGAGALQGVRFRVGPGEFTTVVGPSGCGKSTLLRIAAGLIVATSGQVNVGTDQLGFVFQDATL